VFFAILTTWRRGRSLLGRSIREGRVTTRRFLNRLIDAPPQRVPGTAVYLTPSSDIAPPALINNTEHNEVVHEQVVLLTVKTERVPHVDDARRINIERLRLGFVAVTARYGYQDEPDVPRALRLACKQGLELDPDRVTYYVATVSLLTTGTARIARWRKHLFALLYRNATPAALYYHLPPDKVFAVGAYVEL
jgi:KUP system potassium uptake protein